MIRPVALRRSNIRLLFLRCGLAAATLALAVALAKLFVTAWLALHYPYELDYGEGIVWQQAINIAAGHGYAPLRVFPAIVYHYPPVYHLVVAAMSKVSGLDMLLVGRLTSFVCALITIVLVSRIAFVIVPAKVDRPIRLFAAIAAGGSFVAVPTTLFWAALMRVDMLSTALSLAGLWWTVEAIRGRRRLVWASIAFVLAVYTKQTAIFAPIAAFGALWITRPAIAWRFAVWLAGLGFIVLTILVTVTHGEFLRHVISYNVNRFDLSRGWLLIAVATSQTMTLSLAVIGACQLIRRLRPLQIDHLRSQAQTNPEVGAQLLVLGYFAIRLVTAPLVLKSGASDNYLIDMCAAAAILTAVPIARAAGAASGNERSISAALVAIVVLGIPLQVWSLSVQFRQAEDRSLLAQQDRLADRLRAIRKPVIGDDMVMLLRAGKPILLEPAIVSELSHTGLYDEASYLALIRRRAFGAFLTEGSKGNSVFDQRYSPAVATAIVTAYPVTERYGRFTLWLPAPGA